MRTTKGELAAEAEVLADMLGAVLKAPRAAIEEGTIWNGETDRRAADRLVDLGLLERDGDRVRVPERVVGRVLRIAGSLLADAILAEGAPEHETIEPDEYGSRDEPEARLVVLHGGRVAWRSGA